MQQKCHFCSIFSRSMVVYIRPLPYRTPDFQQTNSPPTNRETQPCLAVLKTLPHHPNSPANGTKTRNSTNINAHSIHIAHYKLTFLTIYRK